MVFNAPRKRGTNAPPDPTDEARSPVAQLPRSPAPPPSRPQKEGVDFNYLFKVILLRANFVVAGTILMLGGALMKQLTYVPTFVASSSLALQKERDNSLAGVLAEERQSTEMLTRYLNYIRSSEFIMLVAENLKFDDTYRRLNLTLPSELGVTRRKFWRYLRDRVLHRNQNALGEIAVDRPDAILIPVESLAGIIGSMISVSEGRNGDTISISATSLDAETSMLVANAMARTFVKATAEQDQNEVNELKFFLEEQLKNTTDKLKTTELDLINFKQKHNILSIDSEHQSYSRRLSQIEGELETSRLQFKQNQKLLRLYEGRADQFEKQAYSGATVHATDETGNSALHQRLTALRRQKSLVLSQGAGVEKWRLEEIDRLIDETTQSLRASQSQQGGDEALGSADAAVELVGVKARMSELKKQNQDLSGKIEVLEKAQREVQDTLGRVPKDEQVLLNLNRDLSLQFELYSTIKKKLQEVEIKRAALKNHVSVSEIARRPAPAPRPSILMSILFSVLVGIFLGASVAILLEFLDNSVKHKPDLEEAELVVLGEIPHVDTEADKKKTPGKSYRPEMLICKEQPEALASMAFKYVRAQFRGLRDAEGKPVRTITITSPMQADGKSMVVANLGVALAQLDKKTLILDCDFRNPSQQTYFGYQDRDGLTSLLSLKAFLDAVVIRNRVPNLDIIPAGWLHPNPTELISNEKFKLLLDHLKKTYRYILVDAPPVLPVLDASILASLTDAVVMVAKYRKTKKAELVAAHHKILQISHRQVCGILNNVREIKAFGISYGYGYSYSYGYGYPYQYGGARTKAAEASAKAMAQAPTASEADAADVDGEKDRAS